MNKLKSSREMAIETLMAQAMDPKTGQIRDTAKAELLNKINKGEIKLQDRSIYTVKSATGLTTVKMFEEQDRRTIGIFGIDGGKLRKGEFLFVTSIQVLAFTYGSEATDAQKKAVKYADPAAISGFQNGEFSLKSNSKFIVEQISNEVFNTAGGTKDTNVGHYQLDTARFINEQEVIEGIFDFGVSLPDYTLLKVILHGCSTTAN